jgi:hypothetical protein
MFNENLKKFMIKIEKVDEKWENLVNGASRALCSFSWFFLLDLNWM